jgi:dUTP pyrophosphatase
MNISYTGTKPIYATANAAGADLFASMADVIEPGKSKLIKTGTKVELPEGTCAQVCSRSGLAAKFQVFVLNAPGIIDSDYRGDVGAIMMNLGSEPFVVNVGDRVAQLVILSYIGANFVPSEELSATARGEGGFGSTGVSKEMLCCSISPSQPRSD